MCLKNYSKEYDYIFKNEIKLIKINIRILLILYMQK